MLFKKRFLLLLLASAAAMPMACAADSGTPTAHKITAEKAKQMMEEDTDIVVVDVRTPEEYAEGHIDGAVLIPNETISDSKPDLLPDLDAEILVYCRSGARSAQAAKKLVKMGYVNIYDFGGIILWPYGTVDTADT